MVEDSVFDFNSATIALQKPKQNMRVLLKALHIIRTEMEWPWLRDSWCMMKFCRNGCMRYLINILKRNENAVLNECLNILEHCSMDANMSKYMVDIDILRELNGVLVRHQDNILVNRRVFRILYNLSQHWHKFLSVVLSQTPQLIKRIAVNLKQCSSSCTPCDNSHKTVMKGIKLFRKIIDWEKEEEFFSDILDAVGYVLIVYTAKLRDGEIHESLLIEIAFLLYDYSHNAGVPHMLQLQHTELGDSLQCFGVLISLTPAIVMEVMNNFLSNGVTLDSLPVPEICGNLQKLIKLQMHTTSPVVRSYIRYLCRLLERRENHSIERNQSSIPFLIQILKELTAEVEHSQPFFANTIHEGDHYYFYRMDLQVNCCSIIIQTLQKCTYDNSLVAILIEHDVINALIGIIQWMSLDSYAKTRSGNVTSLASTSERYIPKKRKRISINEGVYVPSMGTLTANLSVLNLYEDEDFLTDFDVEYNNKTSDIDRVHPDAEMHNLRMSHNLLTRIVIEMFESFSEVQPPIRQLGSLQVLNMLLGITKRVSDNRVCYSTRAICKILRSHEHLVPLLQSDFIQNVMDLVATRFNFIRVSHIGRLILQKITSVAQSNHGSSEITDFLKDGRSPKRNLILNLPYVIRDTHLLFKFMVCCGGLDIILDNLRNKHVRHKCLLSLTMMMRQRFRVSNYTTKEFDISTDYTLTDSCENIVTFIFDSGCKIHGDRKFLSKKSDYFNTLLCGHFKESHEDVIPLKNVDENSFRHLLNLLHCDINRKENTFLKLDLSLEEMIDVVHLSDNYLLMDLGHVLTESLVEFKLTAENAARIYQWALEFGLSYLRARTIQYILAVRNIKDDQISTVFERLFNLQCRDQLYEDIRRVVVNCLDTTSDSEKLYFVS